MPQPVGDGAAGRLLGAVLERVASVEHEVGDRRRDPEDPPASRGWSTPKLILPKRGVWERHADAIRFCATDTNSDPFCGDVASDRAWRCWRAPQPQSGSRCDEGALDTRWDGHIARRYVDASANANSRRATEPSGDPAWSPTISARRPTCRDRQVRAHARLRRPPRSRHQAMAADRRLTVDPRLLPGPSHGPDRIFAPPPGTARAQAASPLGVNAPAAFPGPGQAPPPGRPRRGAVGSTPAHCGGPATRREPATAPA